ncbi:hypothetical protein BKA70DRAFT_1274841 [Coprinopsis sp. MPI-PUGE-AT-0042]|nr:hypothetical protein BKA70DRAFT_1274841 [Coprinopsis sp. MPI-PUGE-AT-0042]
MSFLRRKSKQEAAPPKQPLIVSSPAAPAPTPLYAKFTASSASNAGPARNVSSPMTLSSNPRREPSIKQPAGRSSKTTASSSWYVQPQAVDRPMSASPPGHVRNFSRPIQSRTSLNTFEDKPLPVPGQPSSPVRRPAVQTSFSPPPPQFNGSSSITNLQDDEFELATPIAVPRRHEGKPAKTNGMGSGPPRLSYAVDLPPEFALFQPLHLNMTSRANIDQAQPASTYTSSEPKPIPQQSPPKPSSMGNNISAANSLYPSAVGSFQNTRAFVNPQPSSFNGAAPAAKASNRRSLHAEALPPLPTGAMPYVVQGPAPGQLFQPPPVAPIMKGKPRIFAAMGATGDMEDPTPTPVQQYPPNTPSSPPRRPYPTQHPHPQPVSQSPPPSRQVVKQPSFVASQSPLPPLPPTNIPLQFDVPDVSSNGQQPQLRTPRRADSRPLPSPPPPGAQPQQLDRSSVHGSPRTPKKLVKARQNVDASAALARASIMSASVESFHSTVSHVPSHVEHGQGLIKVHPDGHRTLSKNQRPSSSHSRKRSPSRSPSKADAQVLQPVEGDVPTVDQETILKAGIPLDDDPFAKAEGVRVEAVKRQKSKKDNGDSKSVITEADSNPKDDRRSEVSIPREGSYRREKDKGTTRSGSTSQSSEERRRERREKRAREKEERRAKEREAAASHVVEAEPAATTHDVLPSQPGAEIEPAVAAGETDTVAEEEPKFFPFTQFISNPQLLGNLLSFMTFYDWCILSSVSREIRIMLVQSPLLREEVLERFLKTVGYSRWIWAGKDPLQLTLQDLADYMRGVSTPSHEYARVARMYVHSLTVHPSVRDTSLDYTLRGMTTSTRAYTRVVLRLRAQAEKESATSSATPPRSASVPPPPPSASGAAKAANGYSNGYGPARSMSRPSSRAPSPTMSNYSHFGGGSSQVGHGSQSGLGGSTTMQHGNSSQTSLTFRSPLFRLRRAPLLRVFVPSPEGDWLSDKSVMDCETECKKAGVLPLMRMGDVVWDIAVGDEGNVGRLVYDGKYLIDLDYTYNPIGDLPRYIPTLAFPPSYFHRVIRTGAITSNPIAHVDISPWGEEIAANLQLLQDRVKTETPQGTYHNVVRWVHRSSFVIRPPARVMQRGPSMSGRGAQQPHTPRIPIPDMENLFIDSGWYGTLVVETEGTNEALADLQERCGPRAFPPRPKPANPGQAKVREENRKVWRILREKSRPGEIWIKAVSVKERLM